MSYCLNPSCKEPQNLDDAKCCQACGSCLRLQNRYRAIALIGQGGFGRTFLAIDEGEDQRQKAEGKRQKGEQATEEIQSIVDALQSPSSNSLCVIKQFFPQQTVSEPAAIARFQQEAQRLKELGTNPHIPALLAFFEETQQFYLVQEFIDGQNLETVLAEQGAFDEAAIWQLLTELLPVLKFMHDRQIIHRDIKPANLIWQQHDNDSRLVLVDFGAAKLVQAEDLLKVGTCIGSAEYVAPEQARGKAVFASDLYSLGVTCIYLLTDVSPFDLFDSVNDRWIWRQFLTSPISDRLAELLDRLLQNALTKRFQSVAAVMQVMQEVSDKAALTSDRPTLLKCDSLPVQLWQRLRTLNTGLSVQTVAISPDGGVLASGGDSKLIHLWNLSIGDAIATLPGHVQTVRSLAFSPDGSLLASASQDHTIKLTPWQTGHESSRTLHGHTQSVSAIAFHPTSPILASASRDKTIRLWHYQTGEVLQTLMGHKLCVNAVAFSPKGQFLASASSDRTVRLWRLQHTTYRLLDHIEAVFGLAFSPDGQTLATAGDDRTIRLWDVTTGTLLRTLAGHSWSIVALAFTPDGTTLASGSWDTTVKLWPLRQPDSLAISLTGHTASVHALAISPNGKNLVSGSRDGSIQIWQTSHQL